MLDEYKLGLGNISGDILEITNVPNVNTNIGVVIRFALPTKRELIGTETSKRRKLEINNYFRI